jgi:hypothetical protein
MNKIQNNKIFAARRPCRLVRIWRANGGDGALVCHWVIAEAATLGMNMDEQKRDRTGGPRLCP